MIAQNQKMESTTKIQYKNELVSFIEQSDCPEKTLQNAFDIFSRLAKGEDISRIAAGYGLVITPEGDFIRR